MKLQSIILSLTVSLASVIHAQACTIFLRGTAYTSQTGDVGGGCFGLGADNFLQEVRASDPGTTYTFFPNYGCQGNPIGSGMDDTFFPYIQPSSVRLVCPRGT
ncbi:3432_t:CDS:2 [Ambispora leptoticha]|uniref:3432_t:CDS:1 n=1 Tax=Ambispora leptoticha TaxID=144679 RepID=A0A9N9G5W6_9GLOM|nr:3432_t:CDS:2 [Ambispora leptoticha]